MKNLFAGAAIAAAMLGTAVLMPAAASAGERVNDMALGAASGALVAGPVGLVAGGVIGYVAGPGISHSMGFRHHHGERRSATVRRSEKSGDARPAGEVKPDVH
jgi:hypothetical protein